MKKVVVSLSTYNGFKYVGQMIDSIMMQSYENLELCIRDDGSTDDTVKIIRSFQNRTYAGKTITLLNDSTNNWDNMGPHPSFRFLFQHLPSGDYYVFCDQDDVWTPDKVEHIVAALQDYPEDQPVLYAHSYYICDGNLNVQDTLKPMISYTQEQMAHVSLAKVIMTGTWGGVGMAQACNAYTKKLAFDSFLEGTVAGDCWISWVVAGHNGAFLFDSTPLAYYRRHSGTYSAGNARGLKQYKDWKKNMNRHCDNIRIGIQNYYRLYYQDMAPERQHFLTVFAGRQRLRKFFYPHRLRENFLHEIVFRLLILMGMF